MKTDPAGYDAISGADILAALGDPALIIDDHGQIVVANALAMQLPRTTPGALIGAQLAEAFPLVAASLKSQANSDTYVALNDVGQCQTYRVRVSLLSGSAQNPKARLIMLCDSSAEERLRTLFASLHDLIFVIDDAGRFTEYHKPHRSLLYRRPEEFLGRRYVEILPPAVAEQLRAAIDQVRTTGEVCQIDYSLPLGNQERWFSANVSPMMGRQPGPMTFLVAARDITDRKHAEAVEHEQRVMAEALREVGVVLTSTLQLDEVWDHILANVERVVPSDSATILLIEGDTGHVVRAHGYTEHNLDDLLLDYTVPIHHFAHFQRMIDTQQPYLIPDTRALEDWLLMDRSNYPDWLFDQLIHVARSYLGAPILLDGHAIGFINLESNQVGYFTPADAVHLQVFADYAASAIRNARLYAQAQEIAAVHERQRLARDLHDAVSQMLFSAKIIVEMLPRLRERDPDSVWAYLPELHKLVQGAMGEMRTLLLELRPGSLTDVDLDVLLRYLTDASGGRTAANVLLTVEGHARLPKAAQIALYRIAQEALNNSVKHAHASNIDVTLVNQPDRVILSVCDDGSGFDKARLRPEQLGLSIMRERAQEIGADLSIHSTPGAGTDIRVLWLRPTTGD